MTLKPCEFCGEQSIKLIELTPEVRGRPGMPDLLIHPAVEVYACAKHVEHIEQGRGWQEREKDKIRRNTREAKARLSKEQARLW